MTTSLDNESAVLDQPLTATDHRTMDIFVGCVFSITAMLCLFIYWVIIKIMLTDRDLLKLTAYRFMLMLAIFDNVQLVAHFVTGLMTIWQTVWDPMLAKALGCMATPSYVGYVMTTLSLSLSRLFQFCFPHYEYALFEGRKFFGWLIFILIPVLFFVVALASPYAEISYYPDAYSWDYKWTLQYTYYVQKVEMCIELGVIFISCAFYMAILIYLFIWRRKMSMGNADFKREKLILYQAMTITVYCTALNFTWHNVALLGIDTLAEFTVLNYMWILNSAVYPVLYLALNKTIRSRFLSHAKLLNKSTDITTIKPLATTVKNAGHAQKTMATTTKAMTGFKQATLHHQ